MKKTLALFAVAMLVGAGCASTAPAQTETPAGPSVSRTGTIVSVDMSQIAADGPYVVVFRDAAGATHRIHVPSFGLQVCEARESIADVSTLKAGDAIEVRGTTEEDGAIVPCASSEDYLRLAK